MLLNISRNNQKTYTDIDAIVISGEKETSNKDYQKLDTVNLNNSEHYTEVRTREGYDALDTDEKKYLYEKIQENIYSIANEPDENGHYRTARLKVSDSKMSEFEIREVVNAFIFDNPQVFWFENLFGYAYSGEDTIVEFYSVLSYEDCNQYIETFQTKVDEIIGSLSKGLSEYEREKAIHDIVLGNCTYKAGVTSARDGWEYFSAYGALVNGEAVCEGYAKSMQILLNQVGIACSTVRGSGEGVGHMWNVVKLGGEWYHLDPTWDDSADDTINYDYFNVTTQQIENNHEIAEDIRSLLTRDGERDDAGIKYNFFVPDCNSIKMNYYSVDGYRLEWFDENSDKGMVAAMARHIQDGNYVLPISFGKNYTYDEYVNKLFYEPPHKYYYYVDMVNEQLGEEHRISKTHVVILKSPSNMTLKITMKPADASDEDEYDES